MLGSNTSSVTLHIPLEILAPLLVALIMAGITSYAWLIRKTIELSQIVKDLQDNQNLLSTKIEKLSRGDRR